MIIKMIKMMTIIKMAISTAKMMMTTTIKKITKDKMRLSSFQNTSG